MEWLCKWLSGTAPPLRSHVWPITPAIIPLSPVRSATKSCLVYFWNSSQMGPPLPPPPLLHPDLCHLSDALISSSPNWSLCIQSLQSILIGNRSIFVKQASDLILRFLEYYGTQSSKQCFQKQRCMTWREIYKWIHFIWRVIYLILELYLLYGDPDFLSMMCTLTSF